MISAMAFNLSFDEVFFFFVRGGFLFRIRKENNRKNFISIG